MIKKIKEIFSDYELRQWFIYKLFNPQDKGLISVKGLPPYINKESLNLFQDDLTQYRDIKHGELAALRYSDKCHSNKKNLKLASIRIDVNFSENVNIFDSYFDTINDLSDVEDRESFYRLSFLLHEIENKNSYSCFEKKVIVDWIEFDKESPDISYPYTIAERISNIGIFMCRSQLFSEFDESQCKLFTTKISSDGKLLLQNLEYFGEELTSNHLGNNARGLLWCGHLTNNSNLIDMAANIMLKEYQRIILDNGIAREGSTHYQLLFTRNYYEAYWLLNLTNHSLKNEFKVMFESLLKGACFLHPSNKSLYIGDISPDFEPEWLLGIIDNSRELGWKSHFKDNYPLVPKFNYKNVEVWSDYIRIEKNEFQLLLHINKGGMPFLPGHGHCDSCCIVGLYCGEEFLIDLGRKNYQKESLHYALSSSHNGLLIDKKSREFLPRGVYGEAFKEKIGGPAPKVKIFDDSRVQLEINNFKRIDISVLLTIQIVEGEVHLNYDIKGKGTHVLSHPFYLVDKDVALVESSDGKIEEVSCLRSTRYGYEENGHCINWEKKVSLPYCLNIQIKPKKNKL